MTATVQKERQASKTDDEVEPVAAKPQEKAAELSAEVDDLLDEIDELLGTLPQDLAEKFLQRGGQ